VRSCPWPPRSRIRLTGPAERGPKLLTRRNCAARERPHEPTAPTARLAGTRMGPTKISGLPAHVLLVHLVIAAVPIASLLVIVCALWPVARRRVGIIL